VTTSAPAISARTRSRRMGKGAVSYRPGRVDGEWSPRH
jgi:hypothetical protein